MYLGPSPAAGVGALAAGVGASNLEFVNGSVLAPLAAAGVGAPPSQPLGVGAS
jgi:hypothetical protein